jgi:hypothetical protein
MTVWACALLIMVYILAHFFEISGRHWQYSISRNNRKWNESNSTRCNKIWGYIIGFCLVYLVLTSFTINGFYPWPRTCLRFALRMPAWNTHKYAYHYTRVSQNMVIIVRMFRPLFVRSYFQVFQPIRTADTNELNDNKDYLHFLTPRIAQVSQLLIPLSKIF